MNAAPNPRQIEAEQLRRIRARLAAVAPGNWRRAADDMGEMIVGEDEHGALITLMRCDAATFEEVEFMAASPAMVGFLLALLDRAIEALRKTPPNAETGQGSRREGAAPDYAAEAAMKCAEPAFKTFLEQRHGLERPLTDERAAQKLRSVLGITSRSELNQNTAAADRWRALRQDFQAWRKAG